jgi:hypothetical protein
MRHDLKSLSVAKKRPYDLGHRGTTQIAVQHHPGSAGGDQRFSIVALVIVRGKGERNEYRRLPQDAELCHSAGAGPTETEIGGGIRHGHRLKERLYHRETPKSVIPLPDKRKVARTRGMDELDPLSLICKHGERLHDRLVQPVSPLAAAEDQKGESI